jgi:photosystem II stability/assembly factor-like uncharacterized protein
MLLLLSSVSLHGASWKPEGPWFGNVSNLAVEPSNPDHLYAITCKDAECSAGGRNVWKSDDGGSWWTPAGKELADSDVVWLAVHPSVPGTVYVGTRAYHMHEQGVARSTDGGSSWDWIDFSSSLSDPPGPLSFVPGNPKSMWLPSVNLHARSTDGGAHWTSFYVVVGENDYSDAYGFAFAPSNPRIVWAYSSNGPYLRKSVDGGATWARITEKGYGFLGWCSPAFLVDPADPNRLLVGGDRCRGIVASTDGGASWLPLDDFPDSVTVESLAVDPGKPRTLYASTTDGLYKTTDGGRSWSNIRGNLPKVVKESVVRSILVHPKSSNVLWAGLSNDGVYKSTDGGATWRESYAGMSTAPIDSLCPGANGTMLARTYAGVFRRDTAGRWKPYDGISDIDSIAVDRKNHQIVYAGGDKGVRRSDDGGSTWTEAGGLHDEVARIAIDAADAGILYATSGNNIYRSIDRGEHWKRADEGLPAASVLMLDSDAPGKLFVVVDGYGLWYSADGASSWKPVSSELPKQITDIAIDPADTNHIAVVTKRSAFHEQGFIHSKDGGKTWETASGGLSNQELKAVAFGPGSIVFVAGSEGVFCSKDGGTTWSPFNEGLTNTSVLKLQCARTSLYAGTEAGVFSIDLQ